jgi:hypothetical protein
VVDAASGLAGELSEQVATAADALRALFSSISSKVKVSLGFLQIFSNMTVSVTRLYHCAAILNSSIIAVSHAGCVVQRCYCSCTVRVVH